MFAQFPYGNTLSITININSIVSIYKSTTSESPDKTIIVCSHPIFHTKEFSVVVDVPYTQVLKAIASVAGGQIVDPTYYQ